MNTPATCSAPCPSPAIPASDAAELPWLSYKAWAIRRFGAPVHRIPVDPGWGCPHRNAEGRGGCTFCGDDGARARQLGDAVSPSRQVERALAFARERYRATLFQLYVQAYTATHAPCARLKALVDPLLAAQRYVSLSLGTRPDCLPPDIVELLGEWNRTCEVWVELGVQSVHDDTLRRMRRRHGWAESRDAIRRLRERGLRVCAHLLLGFPGEGADEMVESVDRVVEEGVDALKLHNLHVLADSALGRRWREHPFAVLSETDYLELLMLLLRRIPATVPVFRLFTDSPPERRLAPPPVYAKGAFLRELEVRMKARGWRQGMEVTG